MERNDMASVLKEQGFQQTGTCDEASCLVEVGQLLGVERMVAGSVGKIATMHTISLRMINVATGEIMFTVNEDYQGDLTGVLTTAVGLAAGAFGGGVYMNAETADAADTYNTTRSYDADAHDKNWDDYESNAISRNVLYGVAGAFAAGLAISIPF
jgi:curli biogenesis system outer membrane secretion channel CsgG